MSHIYISQDVVFDENVFPFSKLHENAGARLHSEILLLPPSLLPSNGVANTDLPLLNSHPDNFGTQNFVPSIAAHEMQEADQPRTTGQSFVLAPMPADSNLSGEPEQSLGPIASSASTGDASSLAEPIESPQRVAPQVSACHAQARSASLSLPGLGSSVAQESDGMHSDQGG
jgi:hypothetical protein